jgi:hypothetical protein
MQGTVQIMCFCTSRGYRQSPNMLSPLIVLNGGPCSTTIVAYIERYSLDSSGLTFMRLVLREVLSIVSLYKGFKLHRTLEISTILARLIH